MGRDPPLGPPRGRILPSLFPTGRERRYIHANPTQAWESPPAAALPRDLPTHVWGSLSLDLPGAGIPLPRPIGHRDSPSSPPNSSQISPHPSPPPFPELAQWAGVGFQGHKESRQSTPQGFLQDMKETRHLLMTRNRVYPSISFQSLKTACSTDRTGAHSVTSQQAVESAGREINWIFFFFSALTS